MKSFDDIYRTLHEAYGPLSLIVFDETRGAWGAEAEAALTVAEQDLASAIEQVNFLRRLREGVR